MHYKIQILEILTKAYVELNRLHTVPGERCHMLATSINTTQKLIQQLVKSSLGTPK